MNPRFRFQMANGVYHVTNRGVDRRHIVTHDEERQKWLYCLGDAAIRCGWRVYAYALLTTHFHLFLRTPEPNLSVGMQEFTGRYAAFFNGRQERAGHLFEDRFHAVLVEQDGHAWELSRYLHLNAVRARLVAHPDAYPWSSFPAYMNARLAPAWLDWRTVLGELGRTEAAARVAYRRFVEAGLRSPPPSPFAQAVADSFLGSDEFVQRMLDRFGDGRDHLPAAEGRSQRGLTPEMIVSEVADAMQTTSDAICCAGRQRHHAREVAVWCCRELTEASLDTLAQVFGGVGRSTITETARRCAEQLAQQPALRELVASVRKRLTERTRMGPRPAAGS
jgi:putative transposase